MPTLSQDQWEEVYRLFEEVEELPSEAQESFLSEICRDKPEIYESVKSLLEEDDEADSAFGESVSGFAPLFFGDFETHLEGSQMIGKKIGVYEIKALLGRGGMGSVWLAERDEVFKRQVALKIVRRGMDTEDILRRFRNERQILASLNHPNIAKVFDGGMTEDSLPYFIMEYVDGTPILDYCNHHQLNIEARLKLFQTVCQAVQFAHQNLIIHRDIKPSNILVTKTGEVKLMDFGIAKALKNETLNTSISMTRTHLRILTPEYASPEQIKGENISTASDVYQLGLLLYEILCGHRPYQFSNSSQTEIERVILDTNVTLPSIAFRQPRLEKNGVTRTLTQTCLERSTKPEKLARQLSGDLDIIVQMALRKEPIRRYHSVEQFSEDIRRHLKGLPVNAEFDSPSYRFKKFVIRHKRGVAMTTFFVAALLLIGGYYTYQLARERDRAQQLAKSLSGFFDTFAFEGVQGGKLTVQELLARNEKRLLTELDEIPHVKAQLMYLLGGAYNNLSMPDKGIPLLKQALTLQSNLLGSQNLDVAQTMLELSSAYSATARYDNAKDLAFRALQVRKTLLPSSDVSVAQALNDVGAILSEEQDGNEVQALSFFNEALSIYNKNPAKLPNEYGIATVNQNIGFMHYYRNRFADAAPFLRKALPVYQKYLKDTHPKSIALIATLGRTEAGLGHYKEAGLLQEKALSLRKHLYGEEHVKVATTMSNLAMFYYTIEKYNRADSLYSKTVELQRKLGIDPIADLSDWAWARFQLGDFRQAENYFQEALSKCEAKEGIESTRCAFILGRFGYLQSKIGKVKEGEPKIKNALDLLPKNLPTNSPFIRRTKAALGLCYAMQKRFAEAEPLLIENYHALQQSGSFGRGGIERLKDVITLYELWGKTDKVRQYQALLH